jgi:hypothetical protein
MIKKIWGVLVVGFIVLFLNDISIAQNMKEGLWEITMTMDMPGMPMKMPPQTNTQCLTKKDMVPQKAEPGQECKMVRSEIKGNTVFWVMECKTREGTVLFDGKVTYRGETFDGVIKVKQSGMDMTQNVAGKRIGNCPK